MYVTLLSISKNCVLLIDQAVILKITRLYGSDATKRKQTILISSQNVNYLVRHQPW